MYWGLEKVYKLQADFAICTGLLVGLPIFVMLIALGGVVLPGLNPVLSWNWIVFQAGTRSYSRLELACIPYTIEIPARKSILA